MEYVIKNFDQLATSALRRQALLIAEAGYEATNTKKAVENAVDFDEKKNLLIVQKQKFNLAGKKKISILGIGKAALEAASAIYKILGEKISAGYVIDVRDGDISKEIICRVGSHPLISKQNVAYSKEALNLLSDLTKDDLVIAVISGGGSALFEVPYEMTAEQEAQIFMLLTEQGASIGELNTVRKHISQIKGGQLAKIIYPATCVSLIFSDVPGNDIGTIASGPTVKDETSTRDAMGVLNKYDILKKAELATCKLKETPKEEKYFANVHNVVIVSPEEVLGVMKEKAEDLGFGVEIFSHQFQGQARELGLQIARAAKAGKCLLGAGESTVVIAGQGKGGRNQEMALAALPSISENQVLLCLASDGHDNTEAAGAIIDSSTLNRAHNLGLDIKQYLQNNDSFTFFEAVGDQVITGQTGANVSDFFVYLKN
jgi:glycerate-2-kinase